MSLVFDPFPSHQAGVACVVSGIAPPENPYRFLPALSYRVPNQETA
ncbi:hypothetical protein Deipe_0238 [Deinococcus peraridilitoris DSM 19664]|uniref:Uncharacterized protein n=1 Tax=Deinococcus peraridilitoris (strain DSM 19664 / LMG 22246 / CIP 109416 / KR-200) TaxID=937777 RepID=K9ZYK4_DEIPD|nr:hypothetical protein Deipe_0238 [Deinococcus peraridilitoris DSM 19664]